jgi:hypothetical protein
MLCLTDFYNAKTDLSIVKCQLNQDEHLTRVGENGP